MLDQLVWLNACSSGLSTAAGISSMATLSTFIILPASIPLGAVSQAGVCVSRVAIVLTSKYQKKLSKVTKLVNIITLAIAIFEMSMSKALNNGEIDGREFGILQLLHLKAVNKLTNINQKMESENRLQLQKTYLEEINKIKKILRMRDTS